MEDTLKEFFINSHIGAIGWRKPFPEMFISFAPIPEKSWAKKKYNDLCWQLQKRIAVWRGILATIIATVSFLVINTGLFFISYMWCRNEIFLLACAFLNWKLLELIFLIVGDYYDGNNVTLKRRGRTLSYQY